MMRYPRHIAVLALACAGCWGPSISRFDVTPPVLCGGEKAVVTWDARGETALAIQEEPSEGAASDCLASGQETFALTLTSHSQSNEVERRVELVQLHANATEPIALRANAVEGTNVVATGEKNPGLWESRVEVATIASCQNRPITVEHAGKSAVIVPGNEPSDALSGTPLSGAWELRSTLTDPEVKTPSLRPKELIVLATLRCRKLNGSTE
jgi:hypothetical protein